MQKSPFGFHEGEALLKLAGYYPRLLDVLLESVQNCIDKDSQKIMIGVNQKSRQISIRDDGDGVSQTEFEKALRVFLLPSRSGTSSGASVSASSLLLGSV